MDYPQETIETLHNMVRAQSEAIKSKDRLISSLTESRDHWQKMFYLGLDVEAAQRDQIKILERMIKGEL